MEIPSHIVIPLIFLLFTTIIKYFATKNSKHNTKNKGKKLAQPPGSLPLIGHLHLLVGKGTTLFRNLGTMADKCGPIFLLKLGQRQAIVISRWELVKDCFTKNDMIIASRPNMTLSKYLFYDYACFFISPYGRYWRDLRKISTVELLSNKRLEMMKHVRFSEINFCLKIFYKKCTQANEGGNNKIGKVISLGKWFEYLTFNIALTMIVGKRFPPEMYNESNNIASQFKKEIGKATLLAGLPVPSDFIPWLETLDLFGYISSMKDTFKEIDRIIGNWLDEHIQMRKEEKDSNYADQDFMDVMLSNITEGYAMSGYNRETIIKATSLTLLLTASESISITLSWAISLLLNHPKALKKAQEELDQQIGKQRWAEESDILNLPYLQAIVKETLRLYPPSPLTGPRESLEDCYVDGHVIPKGTRVIINIWKLHRDPRIWAGPDDFRPERFLEENKGIDFRGQYYEYLPFSLGRRSCPGMTFGLQVTQLMLVRVVQGFDMWTEDGGPVDMTEGLGLALPKTSHLDAVLAPRLPNELYEAL